MNSISNLIQGDLILIIAPAKAIEKNLVDYAKNFLIEKGFKIEIGANCFNTHNYFAGTDLERATDFQWAIDHPTAKAILCARGGYGSIRIFDRIQWAAQLRNPKWIIGFSDITLFHQYMQRMELKSLHATMPLNFQENSTASLDTMLNALQGIPYQIEAPTTSFNQLGTTTGEVVGGNLSIIYSLLGTELQPSYKSKILFIEDVGEQIYAIDRMLFSLKKAGTFDQINGLIIGGMTDIKDTTAIPTAFIMEEIVLQHFMFRKIPIAFNFPAGHIDDNQAIIFGQNATLEVTQNSTRLIF